MPLNYSNFFLGKLGGNQEISYLNKLKHTIPFNFNIPKTNGKESRVISLPHPIAQLTMMEFIEKYKNSIVNFCSLSPFSIRSPRKLNSINFSSDTTVENEQKFYNSLFDDKLNASLKISKNDIKREFFSYFVYKKYNNLMQFKNSVEFHRIKLKFDNYMNLDIRNFFDSVYTHALEWAVSGDIQYSKNQVNNKDDLSFKKMCDKICQTINYNETNGIIVGPEFSRIISEILLTRIDLEICRELKNKGLRFNQDYLIYRFIDDFTIFFKNPQENNEYIITKTIEKILRKYKLQLNSEKFLSVKSKEPVLDSAIANLRILMNKLREELNSNKKYKYKNDSTSEFMIKFTELIANYPHKKISIVRYAIKNLNAMAKENLTGFQRKLVLEVLFFILAFSKEHFSIQSTIRILFTFRENIKIEHPDELSVYDNEIFNKLIFFIKQNKQNIDQIYELINFMKFLDNKIPAPVLSSLVEGDILKENYFVLCTVANYILNTEKNTVYHAYHTILKKIIKIIDDVILYYKENYEVRMIDSFYYHLIVDFSQYPLFSSEQFDRRLNESVTQMKGALAAEINEFKEAIKDRYNTFGITGAESINKFLEDITSIGYFKWNMSYESYFKNTILKSINTFKKDRKFTY